jgi:hypothetical protein
VGAALARAESMVRERMTPGVQEKLVDRFTVDLETSSASTEGHAS